MSFIRCVSDVFQGTRRGGEECHVLASLEVQLDLW